MSPRRSGGGRWGDLAWMGGRRRGVASPSFFQYKEVTSDGSQSFLVEVFERTSLSAGRVLQRHPPQTASSIPNLAAATRTRIPFP